MKLRLCIIVAALSISGSFDSSSFSFSSSFLASSSFFCSSVDKHFNSYLYYPLNAHDVKKNLSLSPLNKILILPSIFCRTVASSFSCFFFISCKKCFLDNHPRMWRCKVTTDTANCHFCFLNLILASHRRMHAWTMMIFFNCSSYILDRNSTW